MSPAYRMSRLPVCGLAVTSSTYRSSAEAAADKAHLKRLASALNAANTSLRLDECRAWRISGRRGHIITYGPNGSGWLLYVICRSPQHWTWIKKHLDVCQVVQDGDDEGCLKLTELPTAEQATAVRKSLGIRQARPVPANAFGSSTSARRGRIWAKA
jgi:hypothetical protein